jgi:thioredoxin 1
VSRLATFALAAALAACGSGGPPGGLQPHPRDAEVRDFFGWAAALWLLIPLAGMIAWAVWRAKTKPSTLPVFDDANFETEVLGNRMPVLVHFSLAWNVPNRAALAQTELLAWKNRGAVLVGLLDIDANPRTMERFPNLVPPAYLLFYRGRKLFHRPGLVQADDLQTEIDVALSREGF